jgi:hypothetical protein
VATGLGSDEADLGFVRAAAEDGTADLDYLIQRIFTAGVLLGNALASGVGTVTAVADAISELDEAVLSIQSVLLACEPADGGGNPAPGCLPGGPRNQG